MRLFRPIPFAVLLAVTVLGAVAVPAATSVRDDKWFVRLQANMAQCRTAVDVEARYGSPWSRDERDGGVDVLWWDWAPLLWTLGPLDGCCGFSAGISRETGELLWWSPNWVNHVPSDAESWYPAVADPGLETGASSSP